MGAVYAQLFHLPRAVMTLIHATQLAGWNGKIFPMVENHALMNLLLYTDLIIKLLTLNYSLVNSKDLSFTLKKAT